MADKPALGPIGSEERQRGEDPPADPGRAPLSEQLAATVAPHQDKKPAAEADELTLFDNVRGRSSDDCQCAECEAEDEEERDQWRWY